MSMQLAPPAEGYYEHMSLDLLINQINEQREPSGFELVGELPSTAVPDSQSSAQGARQRGGQRGGRVGGVPEAMTSVFQVQ